IEFASFYNSLGSNVTVVELLPQILPAEDEEVSAFARKQLEKAGVRFVTGAKVTGLKKATDSVTATVDLGDGRTEEVVADRVISAAGVVGNCEGLGLEALGARIERG